MKLFLTLAIVAVFGVALASAQPVAVLDGPADVLESAPEEDFFYQAVPAPPAQPAPPAPPAPHVLTIGPASGSYLGIGAQEIDAERAKELKLPETRGVEVTRVEDDSPAAKAGLKQGDVVLQYNGERVQGTAQFVRLVRETPPGRQVTLQISRNGAPQTVTATVGERKALVYGRAFGAGPEVQQDMEKLREDLGKMRLNPKFQQDMARLRSELGDLRLRLPDMAEPLVAWRSPVLGVEAESLTPQLAEFFGVKQGVLVRSVAKNSAAEKAGIKAGDVIVRVDNQEVGTPSGLSRRIRELDSRSSFPVTVVRNRQEVVLNVIPEKQPARLGEDVRPVPERSPRPRAVRVRTPLAASPIL